MRMRHPRLAAWGHALAAAASLLLVAPAAAAERKGGDSVPPPPEVRAVLDRLDAAQQAVRTLRADVVETRTMALLSQPERLEGQVSFERPGRIRWEYVRPDRRVYVLSDGNLTGWIPAQNTVEKVNLSRYEQRVRRMVAFGQESKALLRDFQVSLVPGKAGAPADELLLVPKSRRMAKRVKEVRLWVDRGDGLPHRVLYATPDSSTVTYELKELKINGALAPETFALRTPPGAKVVHGMSSLGFMGGTDDVDEF